MDSELSIILILFVIILPFLIAGIVVLKKPDKYTGTVKAVVEDPNCMTDTYVKDGKVHRRYTCNMTLKYTVNGQDYRTKEAKYNLHFPYNKNDTVHIRYNPKNPQETTTRASNKVLGISFISTGAVLLGCVLIYTSYYIYKKYIKKDY